ncbi:MAG: hypothetical protein IH991_02725 [Planctomycetes bacterium]|nr:hypothetical protein [Planctomycetota bacterium]
MLCRKRRKVDEDRRNYTHWYDKWNTEWSEERVESLAGQELERLHEIKHKVETHPAIESIEPEYD